MIHNWLAGLVILFGLNDMAHEHCPTGCLAEAQATSHVGLQFAGLIFQEELVGEEIALSYSFNRRYGPFQPVAMASVSSDGSIWIGAGARWEQALYDSDFFAEGLIMPGLYHQADGPDLGHVVQFRGSLGLGYEFDNGAQITLSVDHRSNGNIAMPNPGVETISLRYSLVWD